MNGNPYGAVPEALKETRLTLRDLMAAHLENKVMEGRLGLEKSKAETELAMVGANIKRDEIRSLHDTAQLNQAANLFQEGQTQQDIHFNLGQEQTRNLAELADRRRREEFGVNKGFEERRIGIQEKEADANKVLREKQLQETQQTHALEKKRYQLMVDEFNAGNGTMSAKDLGAAIGLDEKEVEAMGYPANAQLNNAQGKGAYKTVKDNPARFYAGVVNTQKRKIETLIPAMKQEKDPVKKAAMQNEYEKSMSTATKAQDMITAGKYQDVWDRAYDAALKAGEPNPVAFADKQGNEYKRTQDNLSALKNQFESQKAGSSPDDVTDMANLSARFSRGTEPWQKNTWLKAQEFIRKGNSVGALNFMRKMDQTLGRKKPETNISTGAGRSFADPNLIDYGPVQ